MHNNIIVIWKVEACNHNFNLTTQVLVAAALKCPQIQSQEVQFFGGACPQTPLGLACFACLCVSRTVNINMPASPTSTMMIGMALPPFSKV